MKTASSKLRRVLADGRFPGMSGMMRGILRCVLGQSDGFAELGITSDGFLLGRLHGDCGFNDLLGAEADLAANWTRLLDATAAATSFPLSHQLRREAEKLFATNIHRF